MKTLENNKSGIRYFIYLLISLLFIVLVFLELLYTGHTFSSIEPMSTNWNDEVFYFLQISGTAKYGTPQGYFGYNLLHANIGTFGTWSPILIYIYSFLYLLFGSTYTAIYSGNIALIVVSLFILFSLCKFSYKKCFLYMIPMLSVCVVRYSYSAMPEALFVSLIIILFALYVRRDDRRCFVLGITIILILSAMRPYLALLSIFYLYDDKDIGKSLVRGIGLMVLGVLLYFVISGYFSSPIPDAGQTVLSSIADNFDYGLIKGIYYTLAQLVKTVFYRVAESLLYFSNIKVIDEVTGAASIYCLYLFTVCLLLLYSLIYQLKKRDHSGLVLFALMIIEFVAISYLDTNYTAGNRHLTALMIFVWLWMIYTISDQQHYTKYMVALTAMIVVVNIRYYSDPFYTWSTVSRDNYDQGDIGKIEISQGDPNNNTLVWDVTDDPNLYLAFSDANAGIGINICMDSKYMDPDTIQYKYVIVSNHGDDYHKFKQSDQWTVFTSNDTYSIFEKISIN
jgi:hypothetical protein